MGGKRKERGPLAVLWDLDGTLVDSERENANNLAGALVHNFDLKIDEKDKQSVIGKSWVDIHKGLKSKYPELTWSLVELISGVNDYIATQTQHGALQVLPGAREALHCFVEKNVKMAVVTGSSRAEAIEALKSFNSLKKVPLFAAEDVPTSKPDPTGYRMAAKKIGVAPDRCLVFEDSEAGIAAAKRAGCKVVAVRMGNFSGQNQSAADFVVDSLESVNWAQVCRWMAQKTTGRV